MNIKADIKKAYQQLGLLENTPLDKIKLVYRRLAIQNHPDKNPGNPHSHKIFTDIKDAYELLVKAHEDNSLFDDETEMQGCSLWQPYVYSFSFFQASAKNMASFAVNTAYCFYSNMRKNR